MISISQWLAEAFKQNSQPMDYEKHIPPHLCNFQSVLSKESLIVEWSPKRSLAQYDADTLD
jgi:hypothetical protein